MPEAKPPDLGGYLADDLGEHAEVTSLRTATQDAHREHR